MFVGRLFVWIVAEAGALSTDWGLGPCHWHCALAASHGAPLQPTCMYIRVCPARPCASTALSLTFLRVYTVY